LKQRAGTLVSGLPRTFAMRDILTSLRHALRVFRTDPAFALAALSILTLGIGANTAIFSVVNSVLLRPLPFQDSDAVVSVYHVPPASAFPGLKLFPVSIANYLDWRSQNDVFESMAAFRGRNMQLSGGNRPQPLLVTLSDAGFFQVLRTKPAYGRVFGDAECVPGKDSVIVLSHGFAVNQFGAPADAVGRQLELNGRSYQVIGVMPPEFQVESWFPASTEGWIPAAWTHENRANRTNHNWMAVARLRPGMTVEKAQSTMNVVSDRLAAQYPEENKGWGATVITLRNDLVGEVRPALLWLLGAVTFVLLIACANTANLVLARTIGRRKELAIRAALGASTHQVLRPVLAETMLLSILGGTLGLLVAQSGQSLVTRALAGSLPQATEVQIDARVLAFTLAASLFTGLAAGLLAGFRLAGRDLTGSLKQGLGRSDSYSGGRGTRTALVISEVALSLMLLVGAGLMIRSLWALRSTEPGFQPANVLTMSVPVPRRPNQQQLNVFYDEFLPRVAALPGVESVAAIDTLPLDGGSEQPIAVEGRPAEVFALQRNVSVREITPKYFKTMRIPMVVGRDFSPEDARGVRPVAVISQSMAKLFWPGENPVGKRFRIMFTPDTVREVIGVVGDIKDRGLDVLEPVAMLYTPVRPEQNGVALVVRAGVDPAHLAPGITNVLANIDPELPVRDIRTMQEIVETTLSQDRFSMWLFASLAALALLLASVGIYSVLAYSVRSRSREIGVRMALGARPVDVLRLVIVEGMKPAAAGIVLGAAGAYALGDLLSKLIYGVSGTDPLTFAVVTALLASVALFACAVPGYRATRIQPIEALHE